MIEQIPSKHREHGIIFSLLGWITNEELWELNKFREKNPEIFNKLFTIIKIELWEMVLNWTITQEQWQWWKIALESFLKLFKI